MTSRTPTTRSRAGCTAHRLVAAASLVLGLVATIGWSQTAGEVAGGTRPAFLDARPGRVLATSADVATLRFTLADNETALPVWIEAYAASLPPDAALLRLVVNGEPYGGGLAPTQELGFRVVMADVLHAGENVIALDGADGVTWARLRATLVADPEALRGCKHMLHPFWMEQPPAAAITNEAIGDEAAAHAFFGVGARVHLDADGVGASPLQRQFDALTYDLDLVFRRTGSNLQSGGPFDGTMRMTAEVVEGPLATIQLDFRMTATAVTFQRLPDGTEEAATWAFGTGTDAETILVTVPGEPLAAKDQFAVRVTYGGTPVRSVDGFAIWTYTAQGMTSVGSVVEPFDARAWWPSKDWPEDKAIVSLAYTAPNAYLAVGNGRLVEQTPEVFPGLTRWEYESEYPIAPYLVVCNVAPYTKHTQSYDSVVGPDFEVAHYVESNQAQPLANWLLAPQMMTALEARIGPYPFSADGYAHASGSFGGGMEHQTISSMSRTSTSTSLVAHELGHQWFGDAISPGRWRDIWLNEGFATYCEALYVESAFGFEGYVDYVNLWTVNGTVLIPPASTTNVSTLFGTAVYRKGGLVLHMLRGRMGDTAFFEGLNDYIQASGGFRYGTARTADFMATMQAHTGENVSAFMSPWLDGGALSLTYGWTPHEHDGRFYVSITSKQAAGPRTFNESLPVDVTTNGAGVVRVQFRSDSQAFRQELIEVPAPATAIARYTPYWRGTFFETEAVRHLHHLPTEVTVVLDSEVLIELPCAGTLGTLSIDPAFGTGLPVNLSLSVTPSVAIVGQARTLGDFNFRVRNVIGTPDGATLDYEPITIHVVAPPGPSLVVVR